MSMTIRRSQLAHMGCVLSLVLASEACLSIRVEAQEKSHTAEDAKAHVSALQEIHRGEAGRKLPPSGLGQDVDSTKTAALVRIDPAAASRRVPQEANAVSEEERLRNAVSRAPVVQQRKPE